jgi:hypothetical protein
MKNIISTIVYSFVCFYSSYSSYDYYTPQEELVPTGVLLTDVSNILTRLGRGEGGSVMSRTNAICNRVIDMTVGAAETDVFAHLAAIQGILGDADVDIKTQAQALRDSLGALDSEAPPASLLAAKDEQKVELVSVANVLLDTPDVPYSDVAAATRSLRPGIARLTADLSLTVSEDPDLTSRTPLNAISYLKSLIGGDEALSLEEMILLLLARLPGGMTTLDAGITALSVD